MNVSSQQQRLAIAFAQELVRDQVDSDVTPHERLWNVARQLNVSQIEAGATRSEGFVKCLPDGTYAVYFSTALSKPRRRYTVAHELAHLVLERFLPHVTHENTVARRGSRQTELERVVDRIAAELIMPTRLVSHALARECRRSMRNDGELNKLRIIREIKARLGVSLTAMVFRLVELGNLLSIVSWQDYDSLRDRSLRRRLRTSEHVGHDSLRVSDGLDSIHPVRSAGCYDGEGVNYLDLETPWGCRRLRCSSWIRKNGLSTRQSFEYWTIGWTWNTESISSYDDSTAVQTD